MYCIWIYEIIIITSSFIENLTEDNETVKTLKEALHFYETQVHETNEGKSLKWWVLR